MTRKRKDKGTSMSIVLSITLVVIVTLGYQSIRLIRVSRSLDQQIKETRKEVSIESQKLEALKVEYENIDSLNHVENVARDKLGMVKDDEIVFRERP